MYRWAIWTIRKGECQRIELLNCGAWEDSWESLINQGDQTSQSESKSTSDHCCLSWGMYWGVQEERKDTSTAKVPNHSSSKQIVCSSTPGGSSERLKALCTLGPPIHALHSPQQHWRPRKGHSGPLRRDMAQGSTGPTTTYQVGLERTEQEYVAESWWLGCGNKREPALHEVPHPKVPWRRSPVISLSEIGWKESISLPLIISLNEVVVKFVGHHKLIYGLDHLPVAILVAASPQLQSCSSGGYWQSCVLLGQGQRPCKASHKTPCPCQDGWYRAVHVNWGGWFREHPWNLMSANFFPY